MVRYGKVQRDVERLLDAKERREAEERSVEEYDDDKDDDD